MPTSSANLAPFNQIGASSHLHQPPMQDYTSNPSIPTATMDPSADPAQARPVSPLKATRKRKRIVISCTECHRRKQKCDRGSPCTNCVSRNKEALCRYENEAARKEQLLEENGNASEDGYRVLKPAKSEAQAQVSAFGYTNVNGNNNTTLGIYQKIESHGPDPAPMASTATSSTGMQGLKDKYKSFIRQLPSKQHVEIMVLTYFKESNCQYYPLDEGIFREQLKNWNSLPFATINKGPLELSGDMQFFPALLFQILASALQFQPPSYDPLLDTLKYAADMTFDDVASEYSESGQQILCLLGKRQTTLVTVQAGFLRTQYLKNCGMVPESWHHLSQTIRDAQEIGLHKDHIDQRSRDEKHDVLELLWIQQLKRRMWLILSLWDVHMGIVLGRPRSVDSRDPRPPFPIDAPIPKNYRAEAPNPRQDTDMPTPLTKLLWTAELGAPLWDIYNLEKEDPLQNNSVRVETMHKLINQISQHCPPFFRAENPDTSFDDREECHWLPQARAYFQSNSAFTIMALHRPYIFTNSSSRTAALKAALDVLQGQRTMFNLMTSMHYKLFSLVLSTFDAIILVAAIFILHPHENLDDVEAAKQHLEWGIERFETMSDRNSMAKSAVGVLYALRVRLQKALKQPDQQVLNGMPILPNSSKAALPSPSNSSGTPNSGMSIKHHSISSNSNSNSNSTLEAPMNNNMYTIPNMSNIPLSNPPPGWDTYHTSMSIPNFNYSAIAPLQPTHDLLYNDLGGFTGAGIPNFNSGNGGMAIPQMGNEQWQFEGVFGDDSFWGFMNNYV